MHDDNYLQVLSSIIIVPACVKKVAMGSALPDSGCERTSINVQSVSSSAPSAAKLIKKAVIILAVVCSASEVINNPVANKSSASSDRMTQMMVALCRNS